MDNSKGITLHNDPLHNATLHSGAAHDAARHDGSEVLVGGFMSVYLVLGPL